MKIDEIEMAMYEVVCLAVKTHGHAFSAQISIMQSLQYFEHLSEPMAEVLAILQKEFDHTQLGGGTEVGQDRIVSSIFVLTRAVVPTEKFPPRPSMDKTTKVPARSPSSYLASRSA